ncbi:putative dehydrogenase [Kibdelosporangium banguiense]|uniref:Dehydrogenase n=1 Tax=Kibdelosporangium banguiense TaxID=1365924 RepID=A0ABS4TX24_9PSEU|nr:Gfo/Idh/MocA family oxidoreductase [Kibdelosporangium banguiense]MBP2328926.1 putative dehydrogenase [Kibdelosporangium banguiense]
MPNQVRWAIIGTGDVSAMIAPDFALARNATVTAVCSRALDTAETFADRFAIPRRYDNLGLLLDDAEIDAVYIATPHGTHHSLAMTALAAGKHVMVEKPMATSSAQVRDILGYARGRGLLAMQAMWSDFSPMAALLKQLLDSDAIGAVTSVQASFGLPFPRSTGSRWNAALGGSTLLDQGIYPVALALSVLGRPDHIRARGRVTANGIDLAEHITFEYKDGRYAQLAASMVDFVEPSATINGTTGWVSLPAPFWVADRLELRSGGFPQALMNSRPRSVTVEGHGFVPMIRAASEAILEQRTEHPLHDAARTLAVFAALDEIRSQLPPGTAVLG